MKVILGLEKCQLVLELSTNHRVVSQCPKKAPNPLSAFKINFFYKYTMLIERLNTVVDIKLGS